MILSLNDGTYTMNFSYFPTQENLTLHSCTYVLIYASLKLDTFDYLLSWDQIMLNFFKFYFDCSYLDTTLRNSLS